MSADKLSSTFKDASAATIEGAKYGLSVSLALVPVLIILNVLRRI